MGGDTVVAQLRQRLASCANANPFEVLDVAYDATAADVRAAFLAATKKYHPSRFARLEADTVKTANELFLRVKEAYNALRNDDRRAALRQQHGPMPAPAAPAAPPPPSPSSPGGSVGVKTTSRARTVAGVEPAPQTTRGVSAARTRAAVRRASVRVASTAGPSSSPEASRAATLRGPGARIARPEPVSSRQATVAGVAPPVSSSVNSVQSAIHDTVRRRNDDFESAIRMSHKGQHEPARKLLQKVAAEDPKEKKYRLHMHYVWGLEHEEAERLDQARSEFQRALNLDPSFKRAHEALSRVEATAHKKGFFSKLFNR